MNGQMTSLIYLERDGKVLMLHRTKKEGDLNRDKWIGVGGRFEPGESPEECARRETREETGYELDALAFRGIVTFVCGDTWEYMFLFTSDAWHGEERECTEGELTWVEKERVWGLNLWEGDKVFFRLLDENHPFFSLKLAYSEEGTLLSAVLDGEALELFDIFDEDMRPTGLVKERGVAHREGALHHTVHTWVVRRRGDGFDVLVQKRAPGKDSHPGCWDISSAGHIEAGGEALPAARRELFEELGLAAGEGELRPIGIHRLYAESVSRGFPFRDREFSDVFVYDTPFDEKDLRLQEAEVSETAWFGLGELMEAVREDSIRHCIHMDELEMLSRALTGSATP